MSAPAYGRYQVAEPPSALADLHLCDGMPGTGLKEVDHESQLAVLDQSDLIQQAIHTTHFIPGCKVDATALGSCTAQATWAFLGSKLPFTQFQHLCTLLINHPASNSPTAYTDAAGAERGAIAFYHRCTDQTGEPGSEWPPTDCGSSGPYIVSELKRIGVATGQQITHAGEGLISLLQGGGVLVGSPFFYSWEEPDADGFVDGQGTAADLEVAIQSGLAGGHEKYIAAIEKLTILPTGKIDPYNTILRERNSWSSAWGDNGCCRIHLSTWMMLSGQSDFRQPTL